MHRETGRTPAQQVKDCRLDGRSARKVREPAVARTPKPIGRPKHTPLKEITFEQAMKAAALLSPEHEAAPPPEPLTPPLKTDGQMTPLEFLQKMQNDHRVAPGLRIQAAIAALPYVHAKIGEAGKKEDRKAKAGDAAKGRFAPALAPESARMQ